MRHLRRPFSPSLTCSALLLAGFAHADNKGFDVKTLEALGYSTEVADFFNREARFLPGTNHVTIVVNAANIYTLDAPFDAAGQLCMDAELLSTLKLRASPHGTQCVPVATLWPDAEVQHYPGQFRVTLMLPEAAFDPAKKNDHIETGGHAALLNYTLYTQKITGQNNDFHFTQGQLEPGLNIKNWVIRNRSHFSRGLNSNEFRSESLYAARTFESQHSMVKIGQFNSSSEAFSGLPIRGVELSSDSAQTQSSALIVPIEGVANTNATVEIRQRGRLIYRTLVPAGPFSLRQVNQFTNGLPAEVTLLEEDGQRHQFSIASAIDPNSHQEATTYQMAVGRYHNPIASIDDEPAHKPLLGMGEVAFSPKARQRYMAAALASSDYQNIMFKASHTSLQGHWVSGSISAVNAKRPHDSASAAPSRTTARPSYKGAQLEIQGQTVLMSGLSAALSAQYRSQNFISPDEAFGGYFWRATNPDSGRLRYAASASLTWSHPRWGAFSYVATQNRYHEKKGSDVTQMLSSNHQWGRASLNFSLQKSSFSTHSAYASLSFPLGRGSISNRAQYVAEALTLGSSYQGRLGDNHGYTIGATKSEHEQRYSGTLNMNTALAQLSASASANNRDSRSLSLTASGSIAYANHSFATSAQPIGDTFALIKVPKQSNLKIQAPGTSAALTNPFGTAILARIRPYSPVLAQIDTKTLPLNRRLNSTTTHLLLARGTVATKNFTVTETRQLLLSVRTLQGQAVSTGASVLSMDGQFLSTVVGDGNIMLTNKEIGQPIRIKAANISECVVHYEAPKNFDPNTDYEAIDAVCR
ncbi:MAG: fimbrial biogenesis outer membrane usher protein [Neisseriaceae bacterium]|nr:fimbrial biogenesis outer membrane usher protein [Neisseriaceae bacterium]